MKRKIIIILLIMVFLFGFINLSKYISYRVEVKKNEKILLDYFNLESAYGMSVNSMKQFEYYKQEPPTEYNITKLIDYYISQLNDIKKGNKRGKNIWENQRLYVTNSPYYKQDGFNYTGYVDENNIDIDFVINELEKRFIYKNGEWFVPLTANSIIELPYGYYVSYNRGDFEKINKIKRFQNVKILDRFLLENDSNKAEKFYKIRTDYIDINNVKQSTEGGDVFYNYDLKLWDTNLYNLYFRYHLSNITLHHHTYDKEKEEEEKRMNDIQTEFQEMMQEYEANLSDEERYFNPAAGN